MDYLMIITWYKIIQLDSQQELLLFWACWKQESSVIIDTGQAKVLYHCYLIPPHQVSHGDLKAEHPRHWFKGRWDGTWIRIGKFPSRAPIMAVEYNGERTSFWGMQAEFESHYCLVLSVGSQLGPFIFLRLSVPSSGKWYKVGFTEPLFHLLPFFSFFLKYIFLGFSQESGTGRVALFLECGHTPTFSCLLSPKPVLWDLQSPNCKCRADFRCMQCKHNTPDGMD